MERFWDIVELVLILGTVLGGLILILLSLPGSRLRKVFSTILFGISALLGIYIISPLDFLPDLIPFIGQLDDLVATVAAAATAITGLILAYKNSPPQLSDENKHEISIRR